MELNLARNVRGNKKGFCIYVGNKRRIRQNVGHFWKEMGDLTPWGMEKTEVINYFFALVFANKCSSHPGCRGQRQGLGE